MSRCQCSRCGRRFVNEKACRMHIVAKHLHGEPIIVPPDEPSLADEIVQAQIDKTSGVAVPKWLAAMLPDR